MTGKWIRRGLAVVETLLVKGRVLASAVARQLDDPYPDSTYTPMEDVSMTDTTTPRGKSPQRYLQDEDGGLVQRPRIADDVWHPALERARAEGYAIGHIISDLLDGWLAGDYVIADDDEESATATTEVDVFDKALAAAQAAFTAVLDEHFGRTYDCTPEDEKRLLAEYQASSGQLRDGAVLHLRTGLIDADFSCWHSGLADENFATDLAAIEEQRS